MAIRPRNRPPNAPVRPVSEAASAEKFPYRQAFSRPPAHRMLGMKKRNDTKKECCTMEERQLDMQLDIDDMIYQDEWQISQR